MPKYLVEMHDGRKFQVEADSPPSEAEVLAHLGGSSSSEPVTPDVERGGLRHPLTSMLAPELEQARSALDQATAAPHGQPIMARSRTGTLYPSETGTGAVNAAKAAARGAGGALIDQAEGVTSPVGMVGAGAAKLSGALANSPDLRRTVGKGMQFVGEYVDLRKPLKFVKKAGQLLENSAADAPPEPPQAPTGPHMDLSQPIRPSTLTQQQIMERIQAVKAAGGTTVPDAAPKGPLGGRLRPITVSPDSPMQPPSNAPPELRQAELTAQLGGRGPLDQPRVQIGAEAVGRQNGLTTQQVRDTTGPIRGEAPGTAAGMPSKPMDRIVQKLIDMGPKGQNMPESAREAYAAAGTSDKTRVQVQAYLDALRKVGFAAPFAAGPALMRDAMMKALGQGDQQ